MLNFKSATLILLLFSIFCSFKPSEVSKKKEEKIFDFSLSIKARASKGKFYNTKVWIYELSNDSNTLIENQYREELDFRFPFDKRYEIILKPDGYLQKKFVVNTSLPSKMENKDREFGTFEFSAVFYKEVPSISSNTYKNSLGEIAYSYEQDNFVMNSYITEFLPQINIENAYKEIQNYDISKIDKTELIDKGVELLAKEKHYEAYLLFKLAKDSTNEYQVNALMARANIRIKKDDEFSVRLLQANNHFHHKNFEEAANLYAEASEIKPDYNYAKQQLTFLADDKKITPKQTEVKGAIETEEFLAKITQVENLLVQNKVAEASNIYFKMVKDISVNLSAETQLRLKTLGDKINSSVFGEQIAMLEKKYDQLFDLAAKNTMEGRLVEARALYLEAKATGYSKEGVDIDLRIKRIDAMISKARQQNLAASKIIQYEDILAKARQAAARGNYALAKKHYLEIRELGLSGDKYNVDSKINAINVILKKQGDHKQYDAQSAVASTQENGIEIYNDLTKPHENNKDGLYNYYVAYGDRALMQNKLSSARFYFNKAIGIKDSEQYPKDQMKEIRKQIRLDLEAKTNKEYDELVDKAMKALAGRKFSTAKFYYTKASQLKPNESFPKNELKKIASGEYE